VTYWAVNAVFLAAVAAVAGAAVLRVRGGGRGGIPLPVLGVALAVLLALTAVFDNVMIAVGLVGYDEGRISGQYIGIAPLEDFAYAVAAVVLLPALWVLLGPHGAGRGRRPLRGGEDPA